MSSDLNLWAAVAAGDVDAARTLLRQPGVDVDAYDEDGATLTYIAAAHGHTAVDELLADEGVFDTGLKYRSMVLPDVFIDQANPADMYAVAGLNAGDIETKVLEVLGVAKIGSKRA